MGILANLFVIVLVVLMGIAGYRDGAWFSMYALVRNTIAYVCAMTFAGPLGRLLEAMITQRGHAREYFFCIAFALIVAIVFVVGRTLKVTYTVPHVPCGIWPDRIAGPILGALNGIVVTGTVFVLWSLVPFAKYLPGDLGSIRVKSGLDTGVTMLRFYSYVERRMGGSRPFLLNEDEPLVADVNGNGRFDNDVAGEAYDDQNGNGIWDRSWLWRYKHQGQILPSDLAGG